MFFNLWTVLNISIILGLIIGVPWFMYTVVKWLKKIESRLESLEKIMNYSKPSDLDVRSK